MLLKELDLKRQVDGWLNKIKVLLAFWLTVILDKYTTKTRLEVFFYFKYKILIGLKIIDLILNRHLHILLVVIFYAFLFCWY